jgi:WD40 repeat protein
MNSLRRHSRNNDRSGVIAIREILLILIVPIGLWMVNHAMTVSESNSTAAARVAVRPVYDISAEPDERHMWVYRLREDVTRINLTSGAVEQSLLMPAAQLSAVAHSRDHSSTLLCSADGTVALFCNGTEAKTENLFPDAACEASVSDDGAVAIVATPSGLFRGWRHQGSEIQDFAFNVTSSSVVLRIGLNPTGHRLFFAKSDGIVSFRTLEAPDHDETTLNVGAECLAFAWSRDERLFGVVTSNAQVRIYDVAQGSVVHQGQLNDRSQQSIDGCVALISPDGRQMAVSTVRSGEIYLWTIEAAVPVRRLSGHDGIVRTMQFSPDSQRLYSGSYDGTIREWSLKTYSQLRIID